MNRVASEFLVGIDILGEEGFGMAVRFLWNATRGHRLAPWRSEYLKWRIETYSGRKADTVDFRYFWFFLWKEKASLLRFLFWTRNFGTPRRQRS
jgi:hypothetical protein